MFIMTNILASLADAYSVRVARTMAEPRLGIKNSIQGSVNLEVLPSADLKEFNQHTKDRNILCVRRGRTIVPLLSPCGFSNGRRLAKTLISLGVHPLDIIIATELKEDRWKFRNSVEWLFWDFKDQGKLNRDELQGE